MARNARKNNDLASAFFAPLKPLTWMLGLAFVGLVVALFWMQFGQSPKPPGAFIAHPQEALAQVSDYSVDSWHSDFKRVPANFSTFEPLHVVHVHTFTERGFSRPFTLRFSLTREKIAELKEEAADSPSSLLQGVEVRRFSKSADSWLPVNGVTRQDSVYGPLFVAKAQRAGIYAMGVPRAVTDERATSPNKKPDDGKGSSSKGDEAKTYSDEVAGTDNSSSVASSNRQKLPIQAYEEGRWSTAAGYFLNTPSKIETGRVATIAIVHEGAVGKAFWNSGQLVRWYVLAPGEGIGTDSVYERESLTSDGDAFLFKWQARTSPVAGDWRIVFEILSLDGEPVARASARISVHGNPEDALGAD